MENINHFGDYSPQPRGAGAESSVENLNLEDNNVEDLALKEAINNITQERMNEIEELAMEYLLQNKENFTARVDMVVRHDFETGDINYEPRLFLDTTVENINNKFDTQIIIKLDKKENMSNEDIAIELEAQIRDWHERNSQQQHDVDNDQHGVAA